MRFRPHPNTFRAHILLRRTRGRVRALGNYLKCRLCKPASVCRFSPGRLHAYLPIAHLSAYIMLGGCSYVRRMADVHPAGHRDFCPGRSAFHPCGLSEGQHSRWQQLVDNPYWSLRSAASLPSISVNRSTMNSRFVHPRSHPLWCVLHTKVLLPGFLNETLSY